MRTRNFQPLWGFLIGTGQIGRGSLVAALLLALVLAPSAAAQAVFVNGQAARLVVGQPSFTRQAPQSSRETIGGAAGVAVAGGHLFIADGNEVGSTPLNNRVLIYNDLSSFIHDLDAEPPQPGAELPDDDFCPVCLGLPDTVLGQTDFDSFGPGLADGVQNPSAVHSDGVTFAVADTDNNRVLIWRTIPTMNGTLPDVVVGQPDFETSSPRTTAEGLRGPQGVWIDSGRLFVADTLNGRVLIYNSIPTSNGSAANIVLGQPDFDTRPEPDITQSNVETTASSMLDPVAVTVTNGQMFVSDLGFSRVMIFSSVPTQNFSPADVVVGQLDFESSVANDSTSLCEALDPPPPSNLDDDMSSTPDDDCEATEEKEQSCADEIDNDCDGMIDFFNDDDCGPAFPRRCEATLHFPRFALSDGEKLYVSDSGNDRVLIYNEIPQENGAAADVVLGQADFQSLRESAGAASLRSPGTLALDGTNLYVADPFTRRVLVFTPAEDQIAENGLVNAAAFQIPASGSIFMEGTLAEGQITTITVGQRKYEHVAEEGDAAPEAAASLVEQINADPYSLVTATPAVQRGNHASGALTFSGEIQPGDRISLDIGDETYVVVVQAGDEPLVMVDRFLHVIKSNPDSRFFALRDTTGDVLNVLRLVFRDIGPAGNDIPYSVSLSPGALITVEAEGEALTGGDLNYGFRVFAKEPGPEGNGIPFSTATAMGETSSAPTRSSQQLKGGSDARELPVGTIGALFGNDFADRIWYPESTDPEVPAEGDGVRGFVDGESGLGSRSMDLPTELGGVRVYVNGVAAPLLSVTPEQIYFFVPFEAVGSTVSVYVRRVRDDGTVTVSAPRAARVARASPGLFAFDGPEPRQAIAVHTTGVAQGRVAVTQVATSEGTTITAGVTLTIRVQGRAYSYVTVDGDSAESVRDGLAAAINNGDGDPDVVASAAREGFFSARADVTLTGEIQAGDTFTVTINGRRYIVVVQEDDTLASIRNKMVDEINSGIGDPEATARRLEGFDPKAPIMQVVARVLGVEGNNITFSVSVNDGSKLMVETNAEEGTLRGGQTPAIVLLTARVVGREANEIEFSAETTDQTIVNVQSRTANLCCGNEPGSLITPENPAAPGEVITLFGTGLGQTAPNPQDLGIRSGQPIPTGESLTVPFVADDFVSSLVDGRSAVIQFVGLMPGQVGVYQINMRLNEGLEDNPAAPVTIAQVLFISNVVTIPIKNVRPRRDAF